MKPSDLESLVAYLDDELDTSARATVEARLQVNAELARALDELRANDALLERALAAAEATADGAAVASKVDAIIAAASPSRSRRESRRWGSLALAASLAGLALGIGLGAAISGQRFDARLARLEASRVEDVRAIERVVALALEKQLSGRPTRWQSRGTDKWVVVTPVRTYRADSGKWCREYIREIADGGKHEALRGIACREGDGSWRPQLWRPLTGES